MRAFQRTALFTDFLLTMLEGNTSLFTAIAFLADTDTEQCLKQASAHIKAAMENGSPFAESLQREQKRYRSFRFTHFHFRLFAVLERTADIVPILQAVQSDIKRKETLHNTLTAVLVYPFFVILLAGIGSLFLLFAGLPFFRQLGLGSTELYRNAVQGFIAAGLFLCTSVSLFFFLIVNIFKDDSEETRFFYLMSRLLSVHLPLTEAVDECIKAAGTLKMKKALIVIKKDLIGGSSLVQAFRHSRFFPIFVCTWLEISQKQGGGVQVFSLLWDHYRTRDEKKRTIAGRFIEPAAIGIAGIYVLLLIQSIILPLLTYSGSIL
ncbi:MAG: type II secretion system F family protein [Treponema sp.]